jgi:radical SAM protein with 4Fe4S-binding SPASM domain
MEQTSDLQSNTHLSLARLRNIGMEMGYQCNVRCSMCSQVDFRPRPKHIDDILIEKILPALGAAETLTISGGEPTIMPAAHRLVQIVMEHHPHLKLTSTTNGMRFQGIWDEAFIRQGISLNISLNAIDPEIYVRVVQFGNQQTVIDTIDRLVRLRDDNDSQLKIRLSSVVTDDTVHELSTFVNWAADHRVDEVVLATDQIHELARYKPSVVQNFIADAYEAIDRHPELTVFAFSEFDAHFAARHRLEPVRQSSSAAKNLCACKVAFDSIFVNPYGYVYPCACTSYYFGNLVNQSLDEIWNSRSAQRFRRRMLKLDFRDCLLTCPCNSAPIGHRRSQFRKALWIARRDPLHVLQKGLRKFGLTTAQIPRKQSKAQ